MTVVENFSRIATHMVKGMMTHEQLMNAYLFIGLPGYAACHKYHYLSETESYISLCEYAANHFDTIISTIQPIHDIPDIIPKSWFVSTRDQVDSKTRIQAIEEGFNEWLRWENVTKQLYSDTYFSLSSIDIPASEFVKKLILDVEEEIVYAKNELLAKRSIGFDIVSIMEEQDKIERSFKKKIKMNP